MVYTGKPSGGCKLCRIRKVKCDEAKPFCMRCTKSKRHCPGYGPVVRDQSKASAEKLKKLRQVSLDGTNSTNSSVSPRSGSSGDHYDTTTPRTTPRTTSLSPPRRNSSPFRIGDQEGDLIECFKNVPGGLLNPLDEQASCLFLSEFVNVPLTPTARGYYSFLPRYLGRGDISVCLSLAFKATSMAALAMRQSKGLRGPALLRAQEHHVSALRAVGQAIADPTEVDNDQTLGAVLMLAFYETLMSKDSIKEYISHIKGAAKIVQMRGQKCLETDEGREMFAMTRNQCLSVQNLFKEAEMSGYSWLLYNEAVQRSNRATVDINLICSQLQQSIDSIIAKAHHPGPEAVEKMLELLGKCRKLEDEFRKLRENPNPHWKVDVAEWVFDRTDEELDTEPTFEGQVYKFFNLPMAVLHLVTWCSHLNLITTMMRCSSWLASAGSEGLDDFDEYGKLVRSASARVDDIVSGVPYFCSWNGYGVIVSQFPCGSTKPDDPLKGEAGLIVMWPIAMAMKSDYATPRQRRYLRGRLRYIADVSGISQARYFINEV
ncbi:negative acting factor [Colletotrichum incanum]|uniref:Negative acting factor n=1 Tax=Colletotrichum incanum TaxID=1573173 RepID=A0A167AJ93_COLIC|nr:negative acting factor [Colletotrichum incanum]